VRLTTALLCDFAQVREGLLFVSSGGINRLWRPKAPARMGVMLALVVQLEGMDELASSHRVEGSVLDAATDERVGGFQAGMRAREELVERNLLGEPVLLPVPVDLRGVSLPRFGSYRLSITIDGEPHTELPFQVAPKPG
jgi:Family of unknown function (DUF6941)